MMDASWMTRCSEQLRQSEERNETLSRELASVRAEKEVLQENRRCMPSNKLREVNLRRCMHPGPRSARVRGSSPRLRGVGRCHADYH